MLLCMTGRASTLYMIGNSLTWDSRPEKTAATANFSGFPMDVGYHIRCASTLSSIVDDPNTVCIDPTETGRFPTALPTFAWDSVSLQHHAREGATLNTDSSAIRTLVELAQTNASNADTTFFIYQPWPKSTQWNSWLDSVSQDPDTRALPRREYSYLLFQTVQEQIPTANFAILPVGDVMFQLDQEMAAGMIPGYSSIQEVYRNSVHLNGVGRFVASMTVLAMHARADPTGPIPPNTYSGTLDNEALRTALQTTVWRVVRTHLHTSEGDMDLDGDQDFDDIEPFVQAMMSPVSYESMFLVSSTFNGDIDGDGILDFDDIDDFLAALTASAEGTHAVPEGSSIELVTFGFFTFVAFVVLHAGRESRSAKVK